MVDREEATPGLHDTPRQESTPEDPNPREGACCFAPWLDVTVHAQQHAHVHVHVHVHVYMCMYVMFYTVDDVPRAPDGVCSNAGMQWMGRGLSVLVPINR